MADLFSESAKGNSKVAWIEIEGKRCAVFHPTRTRGRCRVDNVYLSTSFAIGRFWPTAALHALQLSTPTWRWRARTSIPASGRGSRRCHRSTPPPQRYGNTPSKVHSRRDSGSAFISSASSSRSGFCPHSTARLIR